MDMQVVEISQGVVRVLLKGRLDIMGAAKIDLEFSALAGAQQGIVVDMSEVTFLASIGIRVLVLGAKSVGRRGGSLVLLNPNDMVTDVLVTSGVSNMMEIVRSESEAEAALKAHTAG